MSAIPDLRIDSVLRFGDHDHAMDEAIATGVREPAPPGPEVEPVSPPAAGGRRRRA